MHEKYQRGVSGPQRALKQIIQANKSPSKKTKENQS